MYWRVSRGVPIVLYGMTVQMGHLKTVIILAGGFVLFQEPMPPKKLAGVLCALGGIIWYSLLKMQKKPAAAAQPGSKNPSPAKSGQAPKESEPLMGSATKPHASSA